MDSPFYPRSFLSSKPYSYLVFQNQSQDPLGLLSLSGDSGPELSSQSSSPFLLGSEYPGQYVSSPAPFSKGNVALSRVLHCLPPEGFQWKPLWLFCVADCCTPPTVLPRWSHSAVVTLMEPLALVPESVCSLLFLMCPSVSPLSWAHPVRYSLSSLSRPLGYRGWRKVSRFYLQEVSVRRPLLWEAG